MGSRQSAAHSGVSFQRWRLRSARAGRLLGRVGALSGSLVLAEAVGAAVLVRAGTFADAAGGAGPCGCVFAACRAALSAECSNEFSWACIGEAADGFRQL